MQALNITTFGIKAVSLDLGIRRFCLHTIASIRELRKFFGQQGHAPLPPPPLTKSEGARTPTERNEKRLKCHISLNEQGKSLYADKSATTYNNSSSKSL